MRCLLNSKIAWTLLAAVCLTAICGCGGDSAEPPAPQPSGSFESGGGGSGSTSTSTSSGAAPAEGWGNLTGRFVYGGTPPEPERVNVTKDTEVCGKHELVNESLLVSSDGGVANVVVYVRSKGVPVHPDLEGKAGGEVVMDNKDCRFAPHVQTMTLDDTLILHNSDSISHNTNLRPPGDVSINPLINSGAEAELKLSRAQLSPVEVTCNIHPWMKGYILPRDNPYMAVSTEDGSFTIENLPAGTWEFQVWHERPTFLETSDWPKGRFELTIKPGDNDLGTVTLDPQLFN